MFYKDFVLCNAVRLGSYSESKSWLIAKVSNFSLPTPWPRCRFHIPAFPSAIPSGSLLSDLPGEEKAEGLGRARLWTECAGKERFPGEEGHYRPGRRARSSAWGCSAQDWGAEQQGLRVSMWKRCLRGAPKLSLWWQGSSQGTRTSAVSK